MIHDLLYLVPRRLRLVILHLFSLWLRRITRIRQRPVSRPIESRIVTHVKLQRIYEAPWSPQAFAPSRQHLCLAS